MGPLLILLLGCALLYLGIKKSAGPVWAALMGGPSTASNKGAA